MGGTGRRPRVGFFQWLVWGGSSSLLFTLACLCSSCHTQGWPAPLTSTPGFATDLQCGLGHCTSAPQSPGFC